MQLFFYGLRQRISSVDKKGAVSVGIAPFVRPEISWDFPQWSRVPVRIGEIAIMSEQTFLSDDSPGGPSTDAAVVSETETASPAAQSCGACPTTIVEKYYTGNGVVLCPDCYLAIAGKEREAAALKAQLDAGRTVGEVQEALLRGEYPPRAQAERETP